MVAIALADFTAMLFGAPELLGSSSLWPIALLMPGLSALFMLVLLPRRPRSPRYLLIKLGRNDEAYEELRRLVTQPMLTISYREIEAEHRSLINRRRRHHLQQQQQRVVGDRGNDVAAADKGTWQLAMEIFARPNLRAPMFIAIMAMVGQQFSGCVAVFAYSTAIFVR